MTKNGRKIGCRICTRLKLSFLHLIKIFCLFCILFAANIEAIEGNNLVKNDMGTEAQKQQNVEQNRNVQRQQTKRNVYRLIEPHISVSNIEHIEAITSSEQVVEGIGALINELLSSLDGRTFRLIWLKFLYRMEAEMFHSPHLLIKKSNGNEAKVNMLDAYRMKRIFSALSALIKSIHAIKIGNAKLIKAIKAEFSEDNSKTIEKLEKIKIISEHVKAKLDKLNDTYYFNDYCPNKWPNQMLDPVSILFPVADEKNKFEADGIENRVFSFGDVRVSTSPSRSTSPNRRNGPIFLPSKLSVHLDDADALFFRILFGQNILTNVLASTRKLLAVVHKTDVGNLSEKLKNCLSNVRRTVAPITETLYFGKIVQFYPDGGGQIDLKAFRTVVKDLKAIGLGGQENETSKTAQCLKEAINSDSAKTHRKQLFIYYSELEGLNVSLNKFYGSLKGLLRQYAYKFLKYTTSFEHNQMLNMHHCSCGRYVFKNLFLLQINGNDYFIPGEREDIIKTSKTKVKHGYDQKNNRCVAIKFIRLRNESDEKHVQNEIEILRSFMDAEGTKSRVKHVVEFYGSGRIDNTMHIVFEFGKIDLHGEINEEKLTKERVDSLVNQLVIAIDEIHSMGIVHGDLKPENVMLFSDKQQKSVSNRRFGIGGKKNRQDVLKLIDFGGSFWKDEAKRQRALSRINGTNHSNKNGRISNPYACQLNFLSIVYTPGYASPEQLTHCYCINPLPIKEKTDIWSLGVMLYRMVFGVSFLDEEIKTNQNDAAAIESTLVGYGLPNKILQIAERFLMSIHNSIAQMRFLYSGVMRVEERLKSVMLDMDKAFFMPFSLGEHKRNLKYAGIIKACLQANPFKRPSINTILSFLADKTKHLSANENYKTLTGPELNDSSLIDDFFTAFKYKYEVMKNAYEMLKLPNDQRAIVEHLKAEKHQIDLIVAGISDAFAEHVRSLIQSSYIASKDDSSWQNR